MSLTRAQLSMLLEGIDWRRPDSNAGFLADRSSSVGWRMSRFIAQRSGYRPYHFWGMPSTK